MKSNRTILALGEAYVRVLCERYDDTKPNMRFWIITMMLVLVGLSTWKLR